MRLLPWPYNNKDSIYPEGEQSMAILFLIYLAVGYWAVGRTVYANKILIGTTSAIFFKKFAIALMFGWIVIPWALIKMFTGR